MTNETKTVKIDTTNLIIGDGELVKNGSVVFEGRKIIYAGEAEHAPKASETHTTDTLLPGLWDCHAHYTGWKKLDFSEIFIHDYHAAIRSVADAEVTLKAGITSVREVGGYGVFLNRAIQEGSIVGPRIYGSGGMLSITGGHGDIHALPWYLMDHLNKVSEHPFWNLVDGVAESMKGVRKQLRLGAEVIKFHASGGVLSELDDPINQQFSFEEAKAIVDEATRGNVAVAAHCHGAAGIKNALDVGVKTIEHGTYLDEDLADLMIEKDVILVPTRFINEESQKMRPMLADYVIAKMDKIGDRHMESLKLAIKKGVKIAMGTDILNTYDAPMNRWGDNAKELEYYVNAGMSAMDAIVTATGTAPETLGPRAPLSGMLKEGYDADILMVNSNPLDDIKILQDKANFTGIIKSGKFVER